MSIYITSDDSSEYLAFTYHLIWTKELTGLAHDTHYYGCKFGKGAHPDILWVGYHTSSERVPDFCAKYGDPDKKKIKKKFYGLPHCKETGDIVTCYENRVLTKLNAAARPDYLNKSNGSGNYHTVGMVSVKDYEGNTCRVPTDDPRIGISLFGIQKGMVSVKDKDGNTLQVPTDDPRIGVTLFGVTAGMMVAKDKEGNTHYVPVDDDRIGVDFFHTTLGETVVKDVDGRTFRVPTDDPRIGVTLFGVTAGMMVARDKEGNTHYVPVDDPRIGVSLFGLAKGMIPMRDKNGIIRRVSVDDPRIGVKLFHPGTGMNVVKDGFGNTYKIQKDDPLIGDTLLGIASKQIFATIVATGERVHVSPKDKRWADGSLVRGW